ncbi:uncharacterized protein LOC117116716 [Anneissia japonica]|uniref:uncharacterized protein LOC117116716 n=1 Tax=Anneissia japonica TaxID=1529436 RepID=UPI0014255CBF|nr:uncharacterized protein LOC117116716 [Anneissia japonica]
MLRELMKNTKHGNKTSQNCWDSPLPERYLSKWIGWKDSLYELQNIQLPRCYQPPNFGPIRRREIHVFSDASDVAIGAVAYLRQINNDGEPHVAFLKGKSKLTPKHAVSIPRLELCAAVLATNIVENIKAGIENRMPVDSIMYYTDSKVVLGYISNESKRFHVYVANRVHRIHSVSDRTQWCHIDTDHNPADMASRSTRADRLMDTTWFTGPDFLWETKLITTNRQLTSTVKEIDEGDPEVRKQIKILKTDAQAHTHFQNRFCHFSRWLVLRRAIAILITRARHLKLKTNGTLHNNRADTSILTIDKLKAADIIIFKAVQETFTDEQIKSPNGPLCKLNPFKDENGILRVGGRLRRSDLDLGGRHPILLPKDNHVSRLIAEYFHEQVQHQGRLLTAAALRSGGIWIIGAHNLVRSIINKCNICKRLRGQPVTQQMADLPKDRLESVPPFTNVGIDVFGPWQVVTRKTRGGAAESKRWAVLFTCLSSRAVHIEVINSMDTSSFIMSLRRFTAIRGPVARIRCDQGTNFVGARGEFQTILNDQNVTKFLVSQNCEWIFNPPHASHFGGVWERQIGIIRRILDTMFQKLGKHQLTDEVLRTFMAEACAVVNSHPITTLSTDPNDPLALNPTMLLTQKTSPLQTPPGKFVKEDLYGRKRWRHVQYLADQFWIRWRKEYLQNLQYRQKWLQPKPNISAGDVVILKQKDVPRYSWPLARVKKTLPSEDGRVRKVEVLVCSEGTRRTFLRPVSELILIEKTSEN